MAGILDWMEKGGSLFLCFPTADEMWPASSCFCLSYHNGLYLQTVRQNIPSFPELLSWDVLSLWWENTTTHVIMTCSAIFSHLLVRTTAFWWHSCPFSFARTLPYDLSSGQPDNIQSHHLLKSFPLTLCLISMVPTMLDGPARPYTALFITPVLSVYPISHNWI